MDLNEEMDNSTDIYLKVNFKSIKKGLNDNDRVFKKAVAEFKPLHVNL